MPAGSERPGIELLLMLGFLKIVSWAAIVLVIAAAAAHGVDVKIDFDPGVDFSQYRTIGWREGTPAEDPELERRIHAAIERELIPLGIREVREAPDLIIVTHAAMDVEKSIDVTQFEYWTEYQSWKRPLAVAQERWDTEMGVLIVDLLDAGSGRLIWRGVAIGNVAKTAERRGEKLDRTMAILFKDFPPGQGKRKKSR